MTAPYEVPQEMREFAEKSVQQARKAFEGFLGAVQKNSENMEQAAQTTGQSLKDASFKAASLAEGHVTAAFDLAEKMVKAKDMQELVTLQTEFVRSQMESAQKQAREMGEAVSETIKSAANPKT